MSRNWRQIARGGARANGTKGKHTLPRTSLWSLPAGAYRQQYTAAG